MALSGTLNELTPRFVFLLLTATLGPLLFGYHLAELNAPQEVITCVKKSIDASSAGLPACIPMNPTQFGLVSSFFTLGGLVGALSAGPVTAQQGRQRAMLGSAVFAACGPAFEASAPSIGLLTLGRFLSGVGAGAATVVVPIYISEISPPHQRGLFGAFTQILTNCGILLAQALGLFLSRGQLWRVILAVGGAIALLQALGLLLGGQESPRWLANNGKPSQAKQILRQLRGPAANIEVEVATWGMDAEHDFHDDDDDDGAGGGEQETLLAYENDVDSAPRPTEGLLGSSRKRNEGGGGGGQIGAFRVLRDRDSAPAVLAVSVIMVAQQFTGINSIVMYGVGLLSDLLAANSAVLNVGVAAVNVLITTSCAPLSDRWGRKTCLLLSIAGMGGSAILLAIGIMASLPVLAAVAVVCFVAAFGFGLGPIPFILAAELVRTEAVGATQSWALAANWIATFVVAQFFPLLNEKMGKGQVYFLFAAFALLFAAFVAWFVPETRGKRDADEVWGRKKAPDLED